MRWYSEKLKHPKWQKRRLEILKRDGFACRICNNNNSMLIVHHKGYIKGREPWEYPDNWLLTICEKHNDMAHPKNIKPVTVCNCSKKTRTLRRISNSLIEYSKIIKNKHPNISKTINIIGKYANIAFYSGKPITEDDVIEHLNRRKNFIKIENEINSQQEF